MSLKSKKVKTKKDFVIHDIFKIPQYTIERLDRKIIEKRIQEFEREKASQNTKY